MASSITNLQILDHSSAAKELDLATELFHRINRVISPDRKVLTIAPDTLVPDAIALMTEYGYSQVPVVTENGTVLGVFSFRSFAKKAAKYTLKECKTLKCAPGDLQVEEFLEKFKFAWFTDEMKSVFGAMNQDDGILIGTPDFIGGVLTPMDILCYLYEVAIPFVWVSEIELALRELIKTGLSETQIASAAKCCLLSAYNNKESNVPVSLEKMTFNDYKSLISYGDLWPKFRPVFGGTRQLLSGRLKRINELRNDLFHFRRELTKEDRQTLETHRDWILNKIKKTGVIERVKEAQP
jgi:predicted transcriptional regulator